eukprot:9272646-Alexandrium_andersonii.AAC.1
MHPKQTQPETLIAEPSFARPFWPVRVARAGMSRPSPVLPAHGPRATSRLSLRQASVPAKATSWLTSPRASCEGPPTPPRTPCRQPPSTASTPSATPSVATSSSATPSVATTSTPPKAAFIESLRCVRDQMIMCA